MIARYTFRVILTRTDDTQEDLGQITIDTDAYGDTTESDAMSEALTELKTVGSFLRFRAKLFPAASMKSIDVALLSSENLGAAVPFEDLINPTGDTPA